MKLNKQYCTRCGKLVFDGKGEYPAVCPECGFEFDRAQILKVVLCGLFPGGGQIANGDIIKGMGVMILACLAFTTGLTAPGLILGVLVALMMCSMVVVAANLAANERAMRYAGYSKEPPTIMKK